MSTIKHVATRAGLSFTTVSHVLNGTRRVSDSARERVEPLPAKPRRSQTGLRLDP